MIPIALYGDDSYNALLDDPYNTLLDDPYNALLDDPYNALLDDSYNTNTMGWFLWCMYAEICIKEDPSSHGKLTRCPMKYGECEIWEAAFPHKALLSCYRQTKQNRQDTEE